MPNAPKNFRGSKPKPKRKPWSSTRGTSKSRGYGADWQKLRNAYFAEHPLCERCEAAGKLVDATEVNHRIPFDGVDDPLRLDWDNLQSVCLSCHRKEERARRKR